MVRRLLVSLLAPGALAMLVWFMVPDAVAGWAAGAAEVAHHGRQQPHKRGQRAESPSRALPAPPPVPADCAARLGPKGIYAYARRAGFSGDQAVTATAVALAESAGHVCAHNPVPPDNSYCLMQINMLGRLGPARRARFHLRRNTDLYDPPTCMRVAYAISAHGTNWHPWTTWTRGTYRQFLPVARAAARS